jgi:hypothetical protein
MTDKKFLLILLPGAVILAIVVLMFSFQNLAGGERRGCYCEEMESLTGEFSLGEERAYFEGREIRTLPAKEWLSAREKQILGEAIGGERWIEVDLSEQKLRAWEGDQLFLESLVSTGKWGRTPKGEYRVWGKFKYAKMSGGSRALNTYYYLPNVPYIQYYQNGYGLHGTYWHNNFGHVMSHGCTNLPTPVAEKLFYWTSPSLPLGRNYVRATRSDPGTRIVIHE